ncbi:MAG: hypothetical protein KGL39_39685 [Patescibacteria group bacterium]|nr:hypothetical protein [Patescibacteria group bacterium]
MFPQITEQSVYQLSTTKLHPLGTVFYADQGRKAYRYVQFGGTSTIASGLLVVAPAAPSNSTGLALDPSNTTANLSAGSKQLFITNSTTAVVVDQFADGSVELVGTNGNFSVRVAGNTAAGSGGVITLSLAEPLRNTSALVVGTNTANLRQSLGYNPVASLTAAKAVGVTIMPVPNTSSVTNYGFVQIKGEASVFATTATKDDQVVQDTSGTAGYLANDGAATSEVVGVAQEAAVSNFALVHLNIA